MKREEMTDIAPELAVGWERTHWGWTLVIIAATETYVFPWLRTQADVDDVVFSRSSGDGQGYIVLVEPDLTSELGPMPAEHFLPFWATVDAVKETLPQDIE